MCTGSGIESEKTDSNQVGNGESNKVRNSESNLVGNGDHRKTADSDDIDYVE